MIDEQERFIRIDEVLRKTGRSRAGIYRMISEGRFPPPQKIGLRAVGWKISAVHAWMEAPTSYSHPAPYDPSTG